MSLLDVVTEVRARYVEYFVEVRDEYLRSDVTTAPETLLSLNDDALSNPYRYLRMDLVTLDEDGEPRLTRVESDPVPAVVQAFKFGDVMIEVHPFSWCDVELLMDSEPTDLPTLEKWMTRWLDIEDSGARRPEGVSHTAHSFLPIERVGAWWSLSADFGTAPPEILAEMIDLLIEQGSKSFVVRSPT